VKAGVVLPIFQDDARLAFDVAAEAEAEGIAGGFCYDHLWPMGQAQRPALAPFPVLAAVARRTTTFCVGTLVARVGLVAEDVLIAQFEALAALAPDRVIAGLGTGDHLSVAENDAYGIARTTADARRTSLREIVVELRRRGIPSWVGSGHAQTAAIAIEEQATLNVWDVPPEAVATWSERCAVSWAGPSPVTPEGTPDLRRLERLAAELADAGATWMVLAWPAPLAALAAAVAAR
jgi:hypothetical protein